MYSMSAGPARSTEREPRMSTLIENMIAARELSPAARDMRASDALLQWAEANGVEYADVEFSDGTVISGPLVFYKDGNVLAKNFVCSRGENSTHVVSAVVDWDAVAPHNVEFMRGMYHDDGAARDVVMIRPE